MNNMFESALKLPQGRVNKNLNDYLDRVYLNNKALLDKVCAQQGTGLWGSHIDPKELLRAEVAGIMKHDSTLTPGEAVKVFGRTELFIGSEERRIQNAMIAVKKNAAVYKALRLGWGWNRKLDWKQFQPTTENNVYRMGGVVISFKNSPISIVVTWTDLQGNAQSKAVALQS